MTKRRKVRQNQSFRAPTKMERESGPVESNNEMGNSEYVENPLEVPSAPTSVAKPTASIAKAEKIGAAVKIEQASRIATDLTRKQIDLAGTQIKQTEVEIKNTAALRKAMESLLNEIKGDGKKDGGGEPVSDRPNDPLAAKPAEKLGLRATIANAVKTSVKARANPITGLASAKGLTGLVAQRYAGNPNSIIGAIATSLHEREITKQDEKEKANNFHTGFTTGTEAGRDLLASKKREAEEQIKKEKPGLSGKKFDKEVSKRTEMETRKVTEVIYKEKQAKEETIAKLNEKETALKNKDKLFGLSDAEQRQREQLIAERAKLVQSGNIEKKQQQIVVEPLDKDESAAQDAFDKKRTKKIYELESYHGRKLTDKEVDSIDAALLKASQEQLAQLKIIAGTAKGEAKENNPTATENMQAADAKSAENLENRKKSAEGLKAKAKKGFLGKGKDLLMSKGGDLLKSAGGSILEKMGGSALARGAGALISGIGGLGAGVLGAGAAAATGIAASGQMLFGKEGLMRGGRGTNFANDAANSLTESLTGGKDLGEKLGEWKDDIFGKSDAQKKLDAENAKYEEMRKRIAAKPPVPVNMEKPMRDVKTEIDNKSAEIDKLKAEKPITVNSPPISAPIITNNSTTNVVRQPIRNQEPSFNRTLQRNFV